MKKKSKNNESKNSILKGSGRDIILILLVVFISYKTAKITVKSDVELEKLKYKQETIREIIVTQDIPNARKKIKFLLETKLIDDEDNNISEAFRDLINETKAHNLYLLGKTLEDSAYYSDIDIKLKLELYENAINKYTEALENNPFISNAYHSRGYCYQKIAFLSSLIDQPYFFKESIRNFNEAILIDSINPHSYYLRGLSKQNLRLFEDAKIDYNKAIQIDSNCVEPYFFMGIIYLLTNDLTTSKEYINKALNNNRLIKQNYGILDILIRDILIKLYEKDQLEEAQFIERIINDHIRKHLKPSP